MAAAPDVFLLDDKDDLHVLVAEPAEDRREAVLAAARVCPKQAITVTD
jgi:ferredoxin